MKAADARIRRLLLNGQDVLVPTAPAWREILRSGDLDGAPIRRPEWVERWLEEYGELEPASLGIVRWPDGWVPIQLLTVGPRAIRVHFENVICEHCDRRCGPSATFADPADFVGTGCTDEQRMAEYREFPPRTCPHRHGVLRRRQTMWLASEERP
ncbi:MAG: hypothetical protein K8T90_06060 [Planctomycetes bacterium]|nr:hypothetical protein [Planctomycetota bacterium]